MTQITLEAIKSEQTKLAELIAKFEEQAKSSIHFPDQLIELNADEQYAGIITGKDGEASYHLILLPGKQDDINWKDAKAWASKAGGALPTMREQALLYANLKEQFESSWYWSCEKHAAYSDSAWSQNFYGGDQSGYDIRIKLRARAVRRVEIGK